MKPLFYLITIVFLSFSSCHIYEPIATVKAENNATYKVDYLFEHDGCKVYRFNDSGRYVYFTNCTGDVTVMKKDSTETKIQTMVRGR